MNPISINKAQRKDFWDISGLIADLNQKPESQCIISGQGREAIYKQIIEWDDASEICFAFAGSGNSISGVFGCEYDESLERGWTWGPFVLADDWSGLTESLYLKLLDILPAGIKRLDCFLNIANRRGYNFYLAHGFEKSGYAHVYNARRVAKPMNVFDPCHRLQPSHAKSFMALHETVFPNTYFTAQNILDKIGDNDRVFVHTEGEEALGYVYAKVEVGSGEGYIDFLGVREDSRGKGLGKQLLLTAQQWLFNNKRLSQIGLTVHDDNTNARSLYESVGFILKYTGRSAKKMIGC